MIYNTSAMETNGYRELILLLNQRLLQIYQNTLDSFGYLLSIHTAFLGCEEAEEEKRFTESREALVYQVQSLLSPLLRHLRPDDPALQEIALETGVIPAALVKDLRLVLTFKEESESSLSSPFSPYLETKEDQKDALDEALYRLVLTHRVWSWCKDIGDGMLEYGTESYEVPESDSEDGKNILDGLDELEPEGMFKELTSYLIPDEEDSEEQSQDKEFEASLIKRMIPYYKGGRS